MDRGRTIRAMLALTKNPFVQVGTGISALLAWVGTVSDGFTAWDWLTRWRQALAWADSPWFVWGVALTALGLIAYGIVQVAKAQAKGDETLAERQRSFSEGHTAAVESLSRTLEDGLKVPNMLISYFATKERADVLTKLTAHASKTSGEYRALVAAYQNGDYQCGRRDEHRRNMLDHLSAAQNALQLLYRELGLNWEFQPDNPEVVYLPKEPRSMGGAPFHPTENKVFIEAHHVNWQRINEAFRKVQNAADNEAGKARHELETLRKELQSRA